MYQNESLLQNIINSGATKAAFLPKNEIPTSRHFVAYCEDNICGNYNKSWQCPPACGDFDELWKRLERYDTALIFQLVHPLEDSYDVEGMEQAHKDTRKVLNDASRILEANTGISDYRRFASGGCGVCAKCAFPEPCVNPDRAVAALSAHCVDVSVLGKKTGLPYINGQNTVTYFCMILFKAPNA